MTAKPGAFNNHLQPGLRIARNTRGDDETPEQRNQRVRMMLASAACPDMPGATVEERRAQVAAWAETPEAAGVLAQLADDLSALGLDGKTDCPPAPVRLVDPGDAASIHAGRGVKAKAVAKPAAKPIPVADANGHIPGGSRGTGCGCDPCREKYNAWNRAYKARKRAAARAARAADRPPGAVDPDDADREGKR